MVDERLEELVAIVRAKPVYRSLDEDLVRELGQQELQKRRSFKEAAKQTRSRLHQAAGAYLGAGLNFSQQQEALIAQPGSLQDPALREFCQQSMAAHASTRERLPILQDFYSKIFAGLPPVHSLLDIACGLNPLALPWMPLPSGAAYYGLDIFGDMIDFLNAFLTHVHQPGSFQVYNLVRGLPDGLPPVQLAMLLKTAPCLEQLDKGSSKRLLESIRADYLLVSYPVYSLGGRSKGMAANYENQFYELIDGHNWQVQRFEFLTELAFLVKFGSGHRE